ncbi:hypothetical protein [Streptomyces sp. NPDC057418]|uniref:hypothetical protein n=1 Tax=Streptomyces sp. NPDC057418 TaxID=3346126 RepID=UPI003695EA14
MATFTWEQAIKVLLPDTNSLTNREAVTVEKWRSSDTAHIEIVSGDGKGFSEKFDVSHIIPLTENDYSSGAYSCVIGFNLDWQNVLDSPQSKFNLFHSDAHKVLTELVVSQTRNSGAVSFASFDAAAEVVHGAHAWLAKWVPIIKRWEENVDADESEWKGSAAGAFRKFLDVISTEMSKVQLDLAQPQPQKGATGYPDTFDFSQKSGYETLITNAKQQLNESLYQMYLALELWWWPSGAVEMNRSTSPVWRMRDALAEVMSGAKCTFTWKAQSGGGENAPTIYYPVDPKVVDNGGSDVSQKFWLDGIELAAKKKWLANLQPLDTAAQTYMGKVDTAYLALGGALREGIYQPRLQMPTGGGAGGPTPETPPGGSGSGSGGGPGGDIGGIGEGGSGGGVGGGSGGGAGGGIGGAGSGGIGGGTGSGGSGTGGPKTGLPHSLPGSGTGGGPGSPPPTSLPGSGSSGGGAPLLDKNGKPVAGVDGTPVVLPPGSRIGKDGKVYDANGKPVLGSDGKQIVAPPGAKVGQQPAPEETPGRGLPGAGLDQIRLPEGAKVLPDGTVADAKGKPLLDSNGNPYALPKGATLKDGIVVDASGKPLSRAYQLLTNAEHALNSRPAPHTTTSGGPGGLLDQLGSGSGGSGNGSKSFTGTATGGTTTFGDRAARSVGLSPPGTGATTSAGGDTGSGQPSGGTGTGSGTGSGTQTAQHPMMPPMNPGAAGGGQPNQGKDRQRTTWLTEDEDTWGTDTGSVSGVIGR